MALSLSTLSPIYPAYNQDMLFTAKESTSTNNFNYEFDVYMNGSLQDSFIYPASPTLYSATINLSTILSLYFKSDVYISTGSTICEKINNSIIPYFVNVKSYNAAGTFVSSGTTGVHYTFNGAYNEDEQFNMSAFIMQSGQTGNFLTNYNAIRGITFNDYAYLSVINGHYTNGYQTLNSVFAGVSITRYQNDGSSSTITETYSSTGRTIVNINVSPKQLNSLHTGFIDANTAYYVISEINNRSTQSITIEIINEIKLKKYYNFLYLNRLGGTDFITFVKVSNNVYAITKQLLDQYFVQKVYYPVIDRTLNVQSQFISPDQQQGISELFQSIVVKMWYNNMLNDVRLTNTSIPVSDRYPKNVFVQFTANVMYNAKYYVQLY